MKFVNRKALENFFQTISTQKKDRKMCFNYEKIPLEEKNLKKITEIRNILEEKRRERYKEKTRIDNEKLDINGKPIILIIS